MHLGIKVGPGNWRPKLENGLHVRGAEIFFDLDRLDAYPPLFAWLRTHPVEAGLHSSTMLEGGVVPNLATADGEVRRASAALIQRTLDVAAEYGLRFLVVHPGAYYKWGIRNGRTFVTGARISPQEGDRLLVEEALRLAAYGRAQGVELLVENMPAYDYVSYEPLRRDQAIDVGFAPHTVLHALGEGGVSLCADLGHLYAEVIARAPGEDPFPQVMAATRALAPYVRHLHVSTVLPPWNGTDSHGGFLAADYAAGAVPGREDLLAWLRLFAGRDVWAIPEPWGDAEVHLANYRLLKAWVEEID